jgi:hypothetical protein
MDAAAYAGSLNISFDQSHMLELLQVLGDGRLSQTYLVDQVAAIAAFYTEKVLQDGHSSGVRKSFRQKRNTVLLVGKYFGFDQSHNCFIISLQYYNEWFGYAMLHEKI